MRHAYEMAIYGRDARLWERHANEMADGRDTRLWERHAYEMAYGRCTPMRETRRATAMRSPIGDARL